MNGEDGNVPSSLRTTPGRKMVEVTRCALYGQPFKTWDQQVSGYGIREDQRGNAQEKVRIHRPSAVAARGPSANTIPNYVSPDDFFEHAPESNFRVCVTASACEPLCRPFFNEVVYGTAYRFHGGWIPLSDVAWQFNMERWVITDTTVKGKCGALLRQEPLVTTGCCEREGGHETRQ